MGGEPAGKGPGCVCRAARTLPACPACRARGLSGGTRTLRTTLALRDCRRAAGRGHEPRQPVSPIPRQPASGDLFQLLIPLPSLVTRGAGPPQGPLKKRASLRPEGQERRLSGGCGALPSGTPGASRRRRPSRRPRVSAGWAEVTGLPAAQPGQRVSRGRAASTAPPAGLWLSLFLAWWLHLPACEGSPRSQTRFAGFVPR